MIPLLKRNRPGSILGISLDGNRLEVISLRRGNGAMHVRQHLAVSLALNPLTDAAELVGREIRNHLDQAGIRERRCAVCLPLGWVLTLQTQIPNLSGDERDSFLALEAERGFHSGPDTLFTAPSFFRTPSGEEYASLLAVPRNQLDSLQRVLRAAKLKPLTFALGVSAVQVANSEPGKVVLLAVRSNMVDLQITAGGGIVALRSLDGAIETQGAQKHISAEFIAREIRITLGQLPGGLASAAGKLKVFGQGELAQQLIADLSPRVNALGLRIEAIDKVAGNFDKPVPADVTASPALALAANYVSDVRSELDFLPPKTQAWKQLVATRLSPRKLAWAGAAVGTAVLCVAAAFGYQQWEIVSLSSKWKSMEPSVNELNTDQEQIKKFRPWYDNQQRDTTCRDMQILRKIYEVLPYDGSVSAKKIEIHDVSSVTCSGSARDNESFSRVHAKLGNETNFISNLHAETHGQKPMDFTLTFQWGQQQGGEANGN